jgi:hypothetical protein
MQFHLLGNPPLPLSDILHMTFKPFDVVYRTWVASFSKAASCLSETKAVHSISWPPTKPTASIEATHLCQMECDERHGRRC